MKTKPKKTASDPEIHDCEEFYKSFLEVFPGRIWVIDRNFNFINGNQIFQEHARKFIGRQLEKGESVFVEGMPEQLRKQWMGYYNEVLESGQTLKIEVETTALPEKRIIDYTICPVFSKSNEITGLLITGHDITERKNLESSLKKTNDLLESTQNLTKVGGWEWNIANSVLTWTRETYRIHDLDPETNNLKNKELIEFSLQSYIPEHRPIIQDAFERCCSEGTAYDLELQMVTAKGRKIWIRTIAKPTYENQKLVRVSGNIADITEHKFKDQALQYSEMKFRAIMEQAAEMLFLHDLKGNIVEINQAAIRETGYTAEELLTLSVFDIDPLAAGRLDPENIWNTLENMAQKTFETTHRRKDGSLYPAEITVGKINFGNKDFILAIARNISERKLHETIVKKREELFHSLFDKSLAIKLLIDPDNGAVIDANEAALQFYGYSKEEFQKLNISGINTLSADEIAQRMAEAMAEKRNYFVFKHKLSDGSIRDVEVYSSPVRIDGKVLLHSIIHDITEKKNAELALELSEQHAKALVDAIPDMIFRLNAGGVFLFYKAAKEDLYTQSENFIGRSIKEVLPGWFADLTNKHIEQTLKTKTNQVFDYQLDISDKGTRYYECRMVPYAEDEVLAIVRDVTEIKDFEKEIIEHESNLRAVMEATDDVIVLLNKDGIVLDSNESHARRLKTTRAELIGKNVFDLLEPKIGQQRKEQVRKVIETGKPFFGEDFRAGYWNEFGIYPVFYQNQKTDTVAVYSHDITDKKNFIQLLENKNKELQESEERFRKVFEESPLGIVLVNKNFQFMRVNGRFCQIIGYTDNELRSMTFPEITHPDHLKENKAGIEKLISGQTSVYKTEKRYIRKDKTIIWATTSVSIVMDTKGAFLYFVATVEDITQKKENEELLVKNEEKYRTLYENLRQGIFYQAADGKAIDANRAALEMFGLTKEQFLGKDSFDPRWKVVDENGVTIPPEKHPSMLALQKGVPLNNQTVGVFIPEKGAYNWLIIDAIPQFHEGEEKPYQIFASMQNITERKKAEDDLKQSEERLRQLNASKDKFFSIIAHDLKSPFNSIMGFSELLVEQIKEQDYDGTVEYAGIILQSSHRAIELLTNLMTWARAHTGRMIFNPEYFELVDLVQENIKLLESSALEKSITIVQELPARTPVFADKAMINTILRNLISNALKFTRPGGTISVSLEMKPQKITVSVKDNGVGIPANMINKLFRIDENFSTSGTNKEKGTGLGLIICKEFIDKHEGQIWAESEEGKGSIFSFTLPVSK